MKIVTRTEAFKRGLPRYFTGQPCWAAGHVAERETRSATCVACIAAGWKPGDTKERVIKSGWRANGPYIVTY